MMPTIASVLRFAALTWLSLGLVSVAQASKSVKSLKKLPSWVVELPQVEMRSANGDHDFVSLYDTCLVQIDQAGMMATTTRFAIRILSRDAFARAIARAGYYSDTDKVRKFEAWVLKPDKTAIIYGKSDIGDYASRGNGQIVSTSRYQEIDATGDVAVGSIFAYEYTIKDDGVFANPTWYFQGSEPRAYSRVGFELPAGWEIKPHFFNVDPFDPEIDGSTRSWSLRDLPGVERQDLGPLGSDFLIWMAFTIFPPADSGLKKSLQSFRSWEEIAASYGQQHAAQAMTSPKIAAKTRELTATAKSRWDKIEALAKYARSINYVSINLDLGTGGGYVPRAASEILETNYGDCKDKANLLCAMLSEVGIKAFPFIVNAEDRDTIYEQWPSGSQFNHCIIAIEVGDEFQSDCVVNHPVHGRLLLFDPTSELTGIGDLPESLQGSKGILLAEHSGGLIDIPIVAPENSVLTRKLTAEVYANGGVLAKLQETSRGQSARQERGVYRSEQRPSEYKKRIQSWISEYLPVPRVTDPVVEDDMDANVFELALDFFSPSYGKTMGGSLVIFKPILLERRGSLHFDASKTRTQPLILSPKHLDEAAEIYLPDGFKASDMPDPLQLDEPFGSYSSQIEMLEDRMLIKRKLILRASPIPVEEFESAKSFFERIIKFEQSPVVLERI